jgi:hypothetical protein
MKQRAVVQFLTVKQLSANGIRAELEGVHGHKALCLSAMKKWRNAFPNGRIMPEDDQGLEDPPK